MSVSLPRHRRADTRRSPILFVVVKRVTTFCVSAAHRNVYLRRASCRLMCAECRGQVAGAGRARWGVPAHSAHWRDASGTQHRRQWQAAPPACLVPCQLANAPTVNTHVDERCAAALRLREIADVLKKHALWWAIPTVVFTLLAAAYAFTRQRAYRATQAMYVREEAIGSELGRAGRFDSFEEMKAAQETLLEVARNYNVVAAALQQIGRPEDKPSEQPWPQRDDIEAVQGVIAVSGAQGCRVRTHRSDLSLGPIRDTRPGDHVKQGYLRPARAAAQATSQRAFGRA